MENEEIFVQKSDREEEKEEQTEKMVTKSKMWLKIVHYPKNKVL